jgi:hypothetical protein
MVAFIIFIATSYVALCLLILPYVLWLYLNAPEGYEDPQRGFVIVRPAKTMHERLARWRKRSDTNRQATDNSQAVEISVV